MHIILPKVGLLSVATVSEATHALVDQDSPGRAYVVVATRTGNLRAWCSSRTSKIGATTSRSPASQPKSRTEISALFKNSIPKKAPQPAIAQGLSVDRRAGLQDQASRHSHDRTRLGDTTSWTDGVRQDRSDKLDGFGAGEGARTLDPDLGKVVLYH